MPPLADDLRTRLEKAVIAAREKAEEGARAALQRLYVNTADSKAIPAGFPQASRSLRVHLRAHARQLGDQVPEKGPQKIDRLAAECAYEFWHRMLFARFLAENNLLIHPEHKVSMSLEECQELAIEEGTDGWTFASRSAARMLPQIFRPDDPLLQVPFAPEHKLTLERILADLPAEVFTADDSLGWVYQFWQAKENERVNESGKKISGEELPAVTQFFTEPYMVRFLLHNTIGAWWVSKQGAIQGVRPSEVRLPGYTFDYLRFQENGTPAAGNFPDWPATAAALKLIDPCCGSGHFLVASFELLVRLRMHGEGIDPKQASDAVLRDNLFGLELDPRCTQIAAFNLALAAWRFQQAQGRFDPRQTILPTVNIACSGQALRGRGEEWETLASNNRNLRIGMRWFYDLVCQAPDLGSLIDPNRVGLPLGVALGDLLPLLDQAFQTEAEQIGPDEHERGVAAKGIARAIELLGGKYHLIVTNVPFLTRVKQGETLAKFLDHNYAWSNTDLATAFLERCLRLCCQGGSIALVTPQNWHFLGSYKQLRKRLLTDETWNFVVKLGPAAFRGMNWWAANNQLCILTRETSTAGHMIAGLDVSDTKDLNQKAQWLKSRDLKWSTQAEQLRNPDHRFTLEVGASGELLQKYARSYKGVTTGDDPHYRRVFWEIVGLPDGWRFLQSTVRESKPYGGCESVQWFKAMTEPIQQEGVYIRAEEIWGQLGVTVSQMRHLPVALYTGQPFDTNAATIVAQNPAHLPAIWAFCQSRDFYREVRRIDQQVKVTNATLVKVPFDLAHWQSVAEANGPLPEPHSNDPTQWLFKGNVTCADAPHNLQVAMARLLGYRWPDQVDDKLDTFADRNGIVCLPAIGADKAAAERLRELLAAAYGANWSPTKEESLLAAVGFGGKTLHDWLRDGFFADHCNLFRNRPFLWHIWDGRKDGFSAIVNYHKFGEPRLRDLIYHYVAEWIKRQAKAVEKGESGADARHAAALELQKKLKLIHEGEKPYDIFVRWKPLDQQPIGWEPDLNDGVRINIRPFMEADILRRKPNIKWTKDKGRDPKNAPWFHLFKGDRINDHHLSLEEKRKARGQGGQP